MRNRMLNDSSCFWAVNGLMQSRHLLFVLLLGLLAPTAAAQPGEGAPLDVQPRIYPLALYGSQSGIGFGAGLSVRNLGWPGSHILLTAKPAAHQGRYTLSGATHDPYTSRGYGLIDLRYEANGNQWFHGLGPASASDARVGLDLTTVAARLRLGGYVVGRTLLLQPLIGVLHHETHAVRNEDAEAQSRLDAASRRALDAARGELPNTTDRQTGLVYGLSVSVDTRDRHTLPSRGVHVQGIARRYTELRSADLRFDRFELDLAGYLPLSGYHRLALHARTAITEPRGDAPLPFYLLPRLDAQTMPGYARDRFYGPDLLHLRLAYHFPILQFRDALLAEGMITADAGAVYADLFDQFEFDLSFDDAIPTGQEQYPLRTGASIGLRIAPLFKDTVLFEGSLGLSPEGTSVIRLGFATDVRALRLLPL